jgi:hypothetical protein
MEKIMGMASSDSETAELPKWIIPHISPAGGTPQMNDDNFLHQLFF